MEKQIKAITAADILQLFDGLFTASSIKSGKMYAAVFPKMPKILDTVLSKVLSS